MSLPIRAKPQVDEASVDDAGPEPERKDRSWPFAVGAVMFGLIWPGGGNLLADMAAELLMIVLLAFAVVRTKAFTNWWQDVPRSARRRGKFVVGALVVAQFFSISASAFPLTEWTMYTSPTTNVAAAYQIIGYTAAGEAVDFVPSVTNRTMTTKMPTARVRLYSEQLLVARDDPSDAEAIEHFSEELERVIELLAGLHNQRTPDATVVEVEVLRTTFTPEQRQTGAGVTERVWRQEVGLP